MGYTIRLQDENGNVQAEADDPHGLVNKIAPSEDDPSFALVNFIDPYGDTIFNRVQMPRFLAEWDRLRARAQEMQAEIVHGDIEALAIRCRDGVHLYLKFLGD